MLDQSLREATTANGSYAAFKARPISCNDCPFFAAAGSPLFEWEKVLLFFLR